MEMRRKGSALPVKLWGTFSDEELLSASRSGDTDRFAELWERHRGAGIVAARNIAPTLDPEDIVSEAYAKIFELVRDGRGPQDAFRPYLYRVIRTVSADMLRSPELSTIPVDVATLSEFPDLDEISPWDDGSFDLHAAALAFSTLNPRWQAVLWYTEVEGLAPREVAPMLGVTANSASALAVRAREALQSAWVETHAGGTKYKQECEFTRTHLQRYQRGKLRQRATLEVESHLDLCDDCPAVVAEFTTLNKQLGLVLGLIMLGGVGAAALLGKLSLAGAVGAAGGAVGAAAGSAGVAASNTGAAAGGIGAPAAIAGGVVVGALAIVGSVALAVSLLAPPADTSGDEADVIDSSEISEEGKNNDAKSDKTQDDKVKDDVADPPADLTSGSETSSDFTQVTLPETLPPVVPPTPPLPPVDPPVDPSNPGGGNSGQYRPSYDPGFECYLPGAGLIGTANRYGVIRLRATAPGSTPVEVMNPRYDPSLEGQPGNGFVNGVFPDLAGNTFDFGFFTGVDNNAALGWFAEDPEQFPEWPTLFPGLTVNDVFLEIQLVAPNRDYSSWHVIDTSVTCP